MASSMATTLSFCNHCGQLKLRDVTDQLQKLFNKKHPEPNICGICQKQVKPLDKCHLKDAQKSKNEIKGKREINDVVPLDKQKHSKPSDGKTLDCRVKLETFVKNTTPVNDLNSDGNSSDGSTSSHVDVPLTDASSRPLKATRLRTGAIAVTKYQRENSVTSDEDQDTADDDGDDDDTDYAPEDETVSPSSMKVSKEPDSKEAESMETEQLKVEPVDNPAINEDVTDSPSSMKVSKAESMDMGQLKVEPVDNPAKSRTPREGVHPDLLELMGPMDDPTMPFNCKFCFMPFRNLGFFQNHMKSHTGKDPLENPYKCEVCAKSFDHLRNIVNHMKQRHEIKRIPCTHQECKFVFSTKQNLQNHLKYHSGVNKHMCETCGVAFKISNALKVHKTKHSDARPFPCHFCDKSFSHKRLRMHHERARHQQSERLKCDSCQFTCCAKYDMRIHKEKQCGNRGAFQCERCDQIFTMKSSLEKHIKNNKCTSWKPATITDDKKKASLAVKFDIYDTKWLDPVVIALMGKTSSNDFRFKCKYCASKQWRSPIPFVKHMRLTHPEEPVVTKPYICDQCEGASFLRLSGLSKHVAYHSLGNSAFVCHQCNKQFASKKTLLIHQSTHDPSTKRHMCSVCGSCFRNPHQVKYHESRVHHGVRPYKCRQCDKAFGSSSKLSVHVRRIHSDAEPLICDQCGGRFKEQSTLVSHKLTHTGVKKYACDQCSYRCARSDYLLKHKRIHSGEKPYRCKHCYMTFAVRTSLVLHEKKHHPQAGGSTAEVTAATRSIVPVPVKIHHHQELEVAVSSIAPITTGGSREVGGLNPAMSHQEIIDCIKGSGLYSMPE